jgi:alkane 1-monooxygenase
MASTEHPPGQTRPEQTSDEQPQATSAAAAHADDHPAVARIRAMAPHRLALFTPMAPGDARIWPQGYILGFTAAVFLTTTPFAFFATGRHGLVQIVVFLLFAAAELVFPPDFHIVRPSDERRAARVPAFTALLIAMVVIQMIMLGFGLSQMEYFSVGQAIGGGIAVGFVTGAIGITYAHELGHRNNRFHRLLAHLLMACVGYGWFVIEHYRGHHLRMATPDDPATARAGESIYRFWPRTIAGQWRHAMALERERLGSVWSPRNLALWHTLWAIGAPVALAVWIGPQAAVFWVVQALVAVLLLETVNYIEHYGILRRKLPDGSYEPIAHWHSWNTYAAPTNWLLVHLQRHSDHHVYSRRPYQLLRPHPLAPELPTGYAGSILLAWIPPLWFRSMDRRLAAHLERLPPLDPEALRAASAPDGGPYADPARAQPAFGRGGPALPNPA